jgi:farnesyl diphosphate synthase
MGKAAGKDAAAGKATLVALLGRDQAATRLKAAIAEAEGALAGLPGGAPILRAAAHFIGERRA